MCIGWLDSGGGVFYYVHQRNPHPPPAEEQVKRISCKPKGLHSYCWKFTLSDFEMKPKKWFIRVLGWQITNKYCSLRPPPGGHLPQFFKIYKELNRRERESPPKSQCFSSALTLMSHWGPASALRCRFQRILTNAMKIVLSFPSMNAANVSFCLDCSKSSQDIWNIWLLGDLALHQLNIL